MTFAPGETIGPYRIIEQLGQGGMATVYKAYHANLDRYVAIKVLHPAFKQDANFRKRFQREAKVVAKLDHPNIIPVYDFSEHEGSSYLVMRFVEGETLKAHMMRGTIPSDQIVQLISTVADALTYAHEQGVLHRDIKPSNIMLDDTGRAFVADYGLARMAQAGESTLSQDSMMGTPAYMSPEQARGDKDLDAGTDIYSLGVVLYELTVGRTPFTADTPYAVIHDHIYSPLPPPRSMNPNVPEPVERVLLKVLAKEPEDRYASAAGLAQAFSEAVATAGPEAVASMSATMPVVPLVSATSTAPASPTEKMDETAVPKRKRRWLRRLAILGGVLLLFLIIVGLISSNEESEQRIEELEAALANTAAGDTPPELSPEEAAELPPPSGTGHCPFGSDEFNNLPVDVAEERVAEFPDSACAHLELAVAYGSTDIEELKEPALENLNEAIDLGLSGPTAISLADVMLENAENDSDIGGRLLATDLYFTAYAEEEISEAELLAFWTILDTVEPGNDDSPAISQTPQGRQLLDRLSNDFPDFAFPQSVQAINVLFEDNMARAQSQAIEAIQNQPDSLVAHYAMGEIFFVQFLQGERELPAAALQFGCVINNAPADFRRDLVQGLREEVEGHIEDNAADLSEDQQGQMQEFAESLGSGELPGFNEDRLADQGFPLASFQGCRAGR